MDVSSNVNTDINTNINNEKKTIPRSVKLEAIGLDKNCPKNKISDDTLNILYKKHIEQEYQKLLNEKIKDELVTNNLVTGNQSVNNQSAKDQASNIFNGVADELLNEVVKEVLTEAQKEKEKKKSKNESNIYIKKPKKTIKLDHNSEKYKVTLKFLNALLTCIGMPEINNLTDFKEVRRNDLIKEECEKILDNHLEDIIKQFGRTTILIRNRNVKKAYIITVIKSIVLDCGYAFKSESKMNSTIMDHGRYDVKLTTYYSII